MSFKVATSMLDILESSDEDFFLFSPANDSYYADFLSDLMSLFLGSRETPEVLVPPPLEISFRSMSKRRRSESESSLYPYFSCFVILPHI
jgi:hypothetical protein